MKIGNRNFLILKEILEYNAITGKELENKFHLSRKQLSYSLSKINAYLRDCGYPEIERLTSGKLKVPEQVKKNLDLEQLGIENQEIWFSKEERVDIIRMMLLDDSEQLSLQHFISELKVSKNTVLTDLKKVDGELRQNHLNLIYERKTGYQITGSEYAKRQALLLSLNNLLVQYRHSFIARRICGISAEDIKEMRAMLIQIEEELKIRFAGEMLDINSYFFTIIFARIQKGRKLESIPDSFRHIAGTTEYTVMKMFSERRQVRDTFEIMYLTAHIQSMKIEAVLWARDMPQEPGIKKAVQETIQNFEKLACVSIRDREELEKLLLHHCEPALYRIRYNFHVGLDITEYILPAYQELHNVVCKAVSPLEALIGKKIPEKEMVYISLIIGTYITKEGSFEDGYLRPRAVIVCQNGITVSRFLWSSLKELIPEISFIKCMSISQFEEYQGEFDMVFSTTPLKTEKKLFEIEPLMGEEEQKALRSKVLKTFQQEGVVMPQHEAILQIVKKHISVNSYQKLRKEIDEYFSSQVPGEAVEEKKEIHLKNLLEEKHIRIAKTGMEWQEAVEFAAMPLLYDGSIQIQYVEEMIRNIWENKPWLAVADSVIIAHAGIDAGVNRVGMSILILPEKTDILGYLTAEVVIVLASPDYEQHLTALNELILILEDEQKLKQIKQARTPEDILKLL